MKITIITTTFNSERTVEQTINSIEMQEYADIEHIVVDGASTDNTLRIVNSIESRKKRVVISERDNGIYDAMNKGISLATGDVIGFLNSDDFFAHTKVISTIANAMMDPEIDACYADLDYVSPTDTNKIVRKWRSRVFKPGMFEQGWMPAHPTFYVRSEIFRKFGTFDLQFPRQADFELCMRFMEKGRISTQYCQGVWVKMRTGGISNNSIRGVIKGNIEAYKACKKNELAVGLTFIPKKILSRLSQFF